MKASNIFEERLKEAAKMWNEDFRWLYLVLGFGLGLLSFPFIAYLTEDFYGFLYELVPEIIGILAIFFLIKRLYYQKDIENTKQNLIHTAGSSVNEIAAYAIEEIRQRGWLKGEEAWLSSHEPVSTQRKGILSGTNLRGANLRRLDLSYADLRGAILSNADFSETLLEGADLSGTYLDSAYMREAKLWRARLHGSNLSKANLQEAELIGSHLEGCILESTNLSGANLLEAECYGTNFFGANLSKANLEDAWLVGAYFDAANLSGANLHFAALGSASFDEAILVKTDFGICNLGGNSFLKANLQSAITWGSAFFQVDFRDAILTDSLLVHKDENGQVHQARFDETTILPDGSRYDSKRGIKQMATFGCIISVDDSRYQDFQDS